MKTIENIVSFIKEKQSVKLINIRNESEISNVTNNFEEATENTLMWLSEKNSEFITKIKKGLIICHTNTKLNNISKEISIIMVDNPRSIFSAIVNHFFSEKKIHKIEISLLDNSIVSSNVNIGRGTIIEEDVEIGENTYIGYNNVILKGTKIGKNVIIGNNNTIGGAGFGYEKNSNGDYEHMPHIGNVIIEDDVEIGNNNCIDRSVIGSTILRKNSKIDNLVHIAHGVEIGENSLIIANSMIAGSTTIGQNTWIGPSTSIINKCKIGSNNMTGIGTVVVKSIGNNELHVGVPSKKLRNI